MYGRPTCHVYALLLTRCTHAFHFKVKKEDEEYAVGSFPPTPPYMRIREPSTASAQSSPNCPTPQLTPPSFPFIFFPFSHFTKLAFLSFFPVGG